MERYKKEHIRVVHLTAHQRIELSVKKPINKAFESCGTRGGYLGEGYRINLKTGEWSVTYGISPEDSVSQMAKIGEGRSVSNAESCYTVVMVIDITNEDHIIALANYAARVQRHETQQAIGWMMEEEPIPFKQPEKWAA